MIFADDTQIYLTCPINKLNHGVQRMSYDVNVISDFAYTNGLSLNISKSKILILGSKINVDQLVLEELPLTAINGASIPFATEARNLGVFMRSDLSWKSHLAHIKNVHFTLFRLKYHKNSLSQQLSTQLFFQYWTTAVWSIMTLLTNLMWGFRDLWTAGLDSSLISDVMSILHLFDIVWNGCRLDIGVGTFLVSRSIKYSMLPLRVTILKFFSNVMTHSGGLLDHLYRMLSTFRRLGPKYIATPSTLRAHTYGVLSRLVWWLQHHLRSLRLIYLSTYLPRSLAIPELWLRLRFCQFRRSTCVMLMAAAVSVCLHDCVGIVILGFHFF